MKKGLKVKIIIGAPKKGDMGHRTPMTSKNMRHVGDDKGQSEGKLKAIYNKAMKGEL